MNKNKLEKVLADLKKSLFAKNQKQITSKVKYKFEVVEDSEGITISYPVLEVGAPVEVSTADGSAPAPDGNYLVEGDITITVVDGLISEIEQAEDFEGEDEEVKDEAVAEAVEEIVEAVEKAVEEIESLQTEIETLKEEFSKFSKMNADVKALTNAVAKFSKTPVAESVTKNENVSDKMKNLAGILSNKK